MAADDLQLKKVLETIEREKGIDRNVLIDTIESAVLKAARKKLGMNLDLEARFNEDKGEVEVFRWLRVVEVVEDSAREIGLEEARQKLDQNCDINDELGEKVDTSEFGRIAAQTAKQEIIRRVRDAEREIIYNEYKDRRGEIVTGIVRRYERQNLIVDLGRAEALLPKEEQIPKETNVRIGDRVQAYIKEVKNEDNKPIVTLSRTDEGFLIKLFEMEVPEIYEGIVKIVSAARDPGVRAKIAVTSRDNDVDPVGACVGVKGARVQAVVQELRGEKIDIVLYSEDPARFVCNAIAPAQVSRVIIDEDVRSMELIVPDDQLSLAIGRKGQNVRLASKLTNWRIDILSDQDVQAEQERTIELMQELGGVSKDMLLPIFKLGYRSAQDIMKADQQDLAIIPGIGTQNAQLLHDTAELVVRELEQQRRGVRKQPRPSAEKPAEKPVEAPAPQASEETEAPAEETAAPVEETEASAEETEASAETAETPEKTASEPSEEA
ncbi:MAG: transcription termination/antitermination protein NusA [Myxococcales bacterium]|nr:transcription termination/antitermination protein NusA [Myxococcales bacterium]MCB9643083.1 transcription termination/antitermination protein NusA [Myxococcales bacterium]